MAQVRDAPEPLGFDAMDIQFCEEDLAETIQQLQDEVASLGKMTAEEKMDAFASCDQKIARIKEQRKGYNLEMRQLEKDDQRKYQAKLKEHVARYQSLEQELKWARTELNRKQLMSGAAAVRMDPDKMDGDTMINAAKEVQGKTEDSLKRTKAMVEQSKEVGRGIAEELEKQSEQIKDVTEEMMTIEDKLKRADRLIKVFTKRMMTDKCILCFTFLVTIGVAFIIIYSVVNPDQEQFDVPDELKPPVPGGVSAGDGEEGEGEGGSSGRRRLLRGLAAGVL